MTPLRRKLARAEQTKQVQPRLKLLWYAAELSLFFVLASSFVFAQAAAEYGGATSGIASSISNTNLMKNVQVPDMSSNQKTMLMTQPSKNAKANPNYIFDSMKKGSVAENRKALEDRAGKEAAKLMLKSKPSDAYVKINGKLVGKTPILLIVPPGQYNVTMYGKRMSHAEQKISLLPKETREFLLPLKQLFPTVVKINLR